MTNQDETAIPSETGYGGGLDESWKCPSCGQRNEIRTTCLRCGYDHERRTHSKTRGVKVTPGSVILGGFFGAILGGGVTFALLAVINDIANWSGLEYYAFLLVLIPIGLAVGFVLGAIVFRS
jgi:hypothetical protein